MKKLLFIGLAIVVLIGGFWLWQNYEVDKPAQYKDLVILESPTEGEYISSPVIIEGKARGNWFFEASFPVVTVDWGGLIIGHRIVRAAFILLFTTLF